MPCCSGAFPHPLLQGNHPSAAARQHRQDRLNVCGAVASPQAVPGIDVLPGVCRLQSHSTVPTAPQGHRPRKGQTEQRGEAGRQPRKCTYQQPVDTCHRVRGRHRASGAALDRDAALATALATYMGATPHIQLSQAPSLTTLLLLQASVVSPSS